MDGWKGGKILSWNYRGTTGDGLTSEDDCTLQWMPPRWSKESWETGAKGALGHNVSKISVHPLALFSS